MRQQKFEEALKDIRQQASGDWNTLGDGHPGVRPLDLEEQRVIMARVLNRISRIAQEALRRD